jgi:hypothetical protein
MRLCRWFASCRENRSVAPTAGPIRGGAAKGPFVKRRPPAPLYRGVAVVRTDSVGVDVDFQ